MWKKQSKVAKVYSQSVSQQALSRDSSFCPVHFSLLLLRPEIALATTIFRVLKASN